MIECFHAVHRIFDDILSGSITALSCCWFTKSSKQINKEKFYSFAISSSYFVSSLDWSALYIFSWKVSVAIIGWGKPSVQNYHKEIFLTESNPFHCTVQLSTQLETSKVFKSKGLFFAQFGSKFENFNSEW